MQAFLHESRVWSAQNERLLGFALSIKENSLFYLLQALLLVFITQKTGPKSLAITAKILISLLFLISLANFLTQLQFNQNITPENLQKYGPYALEFIIQTRNIYEMFAVLALNSLAVILFFRKDCKINSITSIFSALSSILLLILLINYWLQNNESRIEKAKFYTKQGFNLSSLIHKKYSEDFIKDFHYEEKIQCHKSKIQTPNIIILMIESLSLQQSKFFSNIHNWTPQIDKIAADNTAFTNFYANSISTEGAQIAILTGNIPIGKVRKLHSSFDGFFNDKNSLVQILKKSG